MPPSRQLSQLSNSQNNFSNSTSINNESSLIHDTGPSDLSDPTFSKMNTVPKEDTLASSSIKNQSFDTSIYFIIFLRPFLLCAQIFYKMFAFRKSSDR
jgi:hypothetical protein